jgi:hypothetical protein
MLEVLIVIYLSSRISKLAEYKHVSKRKWIIQTILFWFIGEIFGIMMISLTGIQVSYEDIYRIELLYVMCAGLFGGFLGYLLVKKRLEDIPDQQRE